MTNDYVSNNLNFNLSI